MQKTETMIKKEASFVIELGGNAHQIDANTLINILTHYNNIVAMANSEWGGGAKEVKLRVTALKKGSFDINLCIESLKNIFSAENAEYLAYLVAIVGGVVKLYGKLRGKPAKDRNEATTIINNGNAQVANTIINVYNTPAVREAVSKSVETANEDANITGIKFSSEMFDDVEYKEEDFPQLIYKDFDKENLPDEKSLIVDDAILIITALSFTKGGNWKFIYQGFPISMSVKEDGLMKLIDSGERFGKGDRIKVKLKINQRFKPEMNAFVNVSYRIEEFVCHIKTPEQPDLFDSQKE